MKYTVTIKKYKNNQCIDTTILHSPAKVRAWLQLKNITGCDRCTLRVTYCKDTFNEVEFSPDWSGLKLALAQFSIFTERDLLLTFT